VKRVDHGDSISAEVRAGLASSRALLAYLAPSAGRKHKRDPALVTGLVRKLWRAAGWTGSWLHEGALARPALRSWRHIDQPSAAAWDRLCAGLASAWEGGCLRGSVPKGWAWTPRGLVELLRLP
jgi:hypothetical protein